MEKIKIPGYLNYGIKVGQTYERTDGSRSTYVVLNVNAFADCDDVVVYDVMENTVRRIDCFKFAMVRYALLKETQTTYISAENVIGKQRLTVNHCFQ